MNLRSSSISSGERAARAAAAASLLGLQAAVSRGTRGRELVAQAKAERVPGWGAGDDQGTQPASEEVLQMLVSDPRRVVVEQQGDERLHRDRPDYAPGVAEPLVHETAEALETRTGFGAQLWPRVAQDRAGVAER